MTVDPRNDHSEDSSEKVPEEVSDNPEIRRLEELEERMRQALATKENPLSDSERTIDRLRRVDAEADEQPGADEQPSS